MSLRSPGKPREFRMLADCLCKKCSASFMEYTDNPLKCPKCNSRQIEVLSEAPKDEVMPIHTFREKQP